MHRRGFLKLAGLGLPSLAACSYTRIDAWHPLIRSDVITSLEDEARIVSGGKLSHTSDGAIRVLFTSGDPYERGYQHGYLLRNEIQENLGYMYKQSLKKFNFAELFDEAYERMRPYIPAEYVEEMHGLAHGSRMPLDIIHAIHALPSISEWGGKRNITKVVKAMMKGELGTSCSNFSATGPASVDGSSYTVRILDWGLHRISKLHQFPLLHVSRPKDRIAFVNIGWMGFIGAISGMNAERITLGEMGYGDPPNETMRGRPMPFLLRDVLGKAKNLADVRKILQESPGDCSFVFLMTDGKTGQSEMYIKDRDRFRVFKAGETITDRVKDKEEVLPGLPNIVYGGHYREKLTAALRENSGRLSPEVYMKELIPQLAMPSNFQNVIYDASRMRIWVSNAKSRTQRAAEQEYTFFDFGKALSGA